MSIKSWFVSLAKKMDEKSAKRTIQHFKKLNIRSIRLDEDVKLYLVTDEGIIERDGLSVRLSEPSMERYKKDFYNDAVREFDELFGAHRELVENGKSVLVWDVQ